MASLEGLSGESLIPPSSSASSTTLWERMKRDIESGQARNVGWKRLVTWDNFWKGLVVAILLGIFVILVVDISTKSKEQHVKIDGLICFECTSDKNMNWTERGLPYEQDCDSNPHNSRRCLPGEICSYSVVVAASMQRVIRGCLNTTDPVGCASLEAPTHQVICNCDTDNCLQ